MKKKDLQSDFSSRQYMIANDFELYYYADQTLTKVRRHTHDYYEFYFFLEGDVSLQIGSDTYPVRFGDMALIPPGTAHQLMNHDARVPYRRFVFWISQSYLQHLCSLSESYAYLIHYVQTSGTFLFHNSAMDFNNIQSRILLLLEELHTDHFGRDAQLTIYVQDLLLFLNRLLYSRTTAPARSDERLLYQQLLTYIEQHLEEDLSLDHLARHFFVNKYYIAHLFKDNIGISIHQFITKKRLLVCKQAILGNVPITEAYLSCGFRDYSSFYRAFKKEYGVSPKDFRDKARYCPGDNR